MTSNQFAIWLFKLIGRVKNIPILIENAEEKKAEEEINTCNAFLQNLYDYATQHEDDIDLFGYKEELADIETQLKFCRDEIDRRKRIWHKVRRGISTALDWSFRLAGLPSFSMRKRLLPPPKD